jgi:hypothetical protein
LAKRHREILAKLDPVAVTRYQITEKDLRTIEKYLQIIQRHLEGVSTWQEIIDFDSPYATSIVVHEIVEIRLLEAQGIQPLKLDTKALQQVNVANIEAHIQAIYEEHLYLQDYINRHYQQFFQVATLVKANRDDEAEIDLQLLLESDVGVFILEDDKVEAARNILAELKGEMP